MRSAEHRFSVRYLVSITMLLMGLWPGAPWANEPLRLAFVTPYSSTGERTALVRAAREAWITPYSNESATAIDVVATDEAGSADIVVAPAELILQGCASGVYQSTGEKSPWAFRPVSGLNDCGLHVAVRRIALGVRPTDADKGIARGIGALFDPEGFPGKRALVAAPDTILEWALLSYDVPHQDLYELLSTERGLKLAFRRLSLIRDHIVWCRTSTCTANALASGDARMALLDDASGSLRRLTRADSGIVMIDDAVLSDPLEIAIVGTGKAAARHAARSFLDSIIEHRRIKAFAEAAGHIDPADTGNATRNAIVRDSAWYARTHARLIKRFSGWLGNVSFIDQK